jgi:integrase
LAPRLPAGGGLGLAGAVALGLFAAWVVDFIAGPAAPPVPAFVQYAWAPALPEPEGQLPPPSLVTAPDRARLPPPEPPPRELTDTEIGALITAATEDARLIAVALLIGLTVEEIIALRWEEVDVTAGAIRIVGADARTLPLDEPTQALLTARQQQQRRLPVGFWKNPPATVWPMRMWRGLSCSPPTMPSSTARRK